MVTGPHHFSAGISHDYGQRVDRLAPITGICWRRGWKRGGYEGKEKEWIVPGFSVEGISHGGVGGWVEDDKRAVGMNRTRRESRIVKKKRKKKGMDPVEERGEGRVSKQ